MANTPVTSYVYPESKGYLHLMREIRVVPDAASRNNEVLVKYFVVECDKQELIPGAYQGIYVTDCSVAQLIAKRDNLYLVDHTK